jgi:hypothetical protein
MGHLFVFIIVLSVMMALIVAEYSKVSSGGSTCGGNCPSSCDRCPCGNTVEYVDIASWCAQYSGWNQTNCQCIVTHESSGNKNAMHVNSNDNSLDVGLW